MSHSRKPRWTWVPAVAGAAIALLAPALAAAPGAPSPGSTLDPAEILLRDLHPEYQTFVHAVHPMTDAAAGASSVYMVLVRAGAADPARRESAPYAGHGARNDILYDPGVLDGTRGAAWTRLLLDHEYFHARHLAGATALPLPLSNGAAIERHFFEAAAWGYTVSEARAGRYPGLREEEFREALDRYGEHYRALRALTREKSPALWTTLGDPLRDVATVTIAGSPLPAVPARPSDPGRAPAIP
jgi:hypothetical protein